MLPWRSAPGSTLMRSWGLRGPQPSFLPLFTDVRGRGILRSSSNLHSRKFHIAPLLRAVHPWTGEESCSSTRIARALSPPWPVRQASLPSAQGVEIGREAGVLVYGCRFQLLLGEA